MSKTTGRTRLYFSGEIPIENFIRERPDDFPNCGVMLTFFTLRTSNKARPARRLTGMIENKPYLDGDKKHKRKKK